MAAATTRDPASMSQAEKPKPGHPDTLGLQLLKLVLEMGPLVVFFFTNSSAGIFAATQAFMVATVVAMIASRIVFGRIAVMPLVTGVFVMVFGGLTLWLQDDHFIKMKPTIVNGLFAAILLGGLGFGQSMLRHVFGDVFRLTAEGWRQLTLRWGLYFIALALLNEIVWRNVSTDTWVSFKTFGIMPLTMIFALSQLGLIKRHELPESTSATSESKT